MTDDRATLGRIISRFEKEPALAFAFVLQTWGSSPRPVGSLLAVSSSRAFEGSVSGGCVENAVIDEAADVLATGIPKRLSYGVSDETAWDLGLPCGGTVKILLLRIDLSIAQQLLTRTPIALIVKTDTGEIALCNSSSWSGDLPGNPSC